MTRCLTTFARIKKLRQHADSVVVYQFKWVMCLMMKMSFGMGRVGGLSVPRKISARPRRGMLCSIEMIWCQLATR